MNHSERLRECTSMYCTGYGAVYQTAVNCVSQLSCGFVSGALRWVLRGKAQRLPTLRGSIQRVATPDTFGADLLGARAEEIPDCSSYSLRILWIATAVGCQSTLRVSCLSESQPGDSTSSLVVKGTSLTTNLVARSQPGDR